MKQKNRMEKLYTWKVHEVLGDKGHIYKIRFLVILENLEFPKK